MQRSEPKGPGATDGELDAVLNRLMREIERFRIDSQRFLAGDLEIPPEELKDRIAASFKRLRATGIRGVSERFRMNTLEAKFNSQSDLYRRRMRERERGAVRLPGVGRTAPDASKGVVFGENGHLQAVEVLYKGLYLQTGTRNPKMDLERFRTYIHRQADTIREKTGCADIQFRVSMEEGRAKIKAKPIRRG